MRILLGGNSFTNGARGGEANVSGSIARNIGKRHECMLLFPPAPIEIRLRLFLRWFSGDCVPWTRLYYRTKVRSFNPDVAVLFGDLDSSMLQACLDSSVPTILALQSYWPVCPKSSFWNDVHSKSCTNIDKSARACTKCIEKSMRYGSSSTLGGAFTVAKTLGMVNDHLIRFSLDRTRNRIQKVRRIVVPSEFVKRVIVRELTVHPEKIEVIHNGVDTSLFVPRDGKERPPRDKKIIVFSAVLSGGLGRLKGFPHFVKLAKMLSKKRKDVRFVAAGGAMSGVEPVECVGYLSQQEIVRLYQDAYLAVVLSVWDEPFGLVVTEPMACAKPTIAYASGGISEIVAEGVTGFLAPTGDWDRISEQVEYLLDDENATRIMGENARKRVETCFSSTSMVEKYLALMQGIAR